MSPQSDESHSVSCSKPAALVHPPPLCIGSNDLSIADLAADRLTAAAAPDIRARHNAPRFSQRRQGRVRRRRHRQRPGRPDGGERAGPRRPQRAAAGAALQARRHGHVVQAARRAHLRHLAARFPIRHGEKLPPLLDAGNRRLDRAAQAHPLRQPDVLAHHVVQPRGLHAAADERFQGRPCRGDCVLRHRPRHELLRRPVDDDPRAVRPLLPRPRRCHSPAHGADHLRQRQHARRPGDQLRHRVLELHVQGRVHVRRRHRQADRPDGARAA